MSIAERMTQIHGKRVEDPAQTIEQIRYYLEDYLKLPGSKFIWFEAKSIMVLIKGHDVLLLSEVRDLLKSEGWCCDSAYDYLVVQ